MQPASDGVGGPVARSAEERAGEPPAAAPGRPGTEPALPPDSRGFRAFLVTQFLGAFNDNVFRFTLLALITASTADSLDAEGRQVSVAQVVFALPFVVFVALFGSLADRFRKSRVMVGAKAAEVLLMLMAMAAFASGELVFLLAVLFLMSTQSAFFGPAKYGYLGERVATGQLVRANGMVSMTTFAAIILGQIAGPWLYEVSGGRLGLGALAFVVVALAGLVTSLGIPSSAAARPRLPPALNPLPWLRETVGGFRGDRTLLYAVGGIVHFYVIAGALQVNLLTYARDILGQGGAAAGSFLASAAVGVCLGSLWAHRLSHDELELGLVPLGATVMSMGLIALSLVGGAADAPGLDGVLNVVGPYLCVLVAGVAGGLFIVPLNAVVQHAAPRDGKGSYLAFSNMMSFFGLALSALLVWLPREWGAGPRGQALVLGLLSLMGTAVSIKVLPVAFARFVAWLVAHTLYRIRVLHPERLPATGGALIVANHVSWVDWLILIGTTRRHMHFLIHRGYFEWWPVRWLLELAGCIPVAAGDPKEQLKASLQAAGARVEAGDLVVIFVEGSVTRTGNLLNVRSGYRRVVAGRNVPVIPVHLDGLWGSIFSHAGGKLLWKLPRSLAHPVTVTYGEPLTSDARPHEVRTAIQRLSSLAWEQRKPFRRPLHVRLLLKRRRSRRRNLHDADGRATSRAQLLAEALALRDALAERLATTGAGQAAGAGGRPPAARRVAVLMDQGLDAARAMVALLAAGRVPVPLDTSLSDEVLDTLILRHRLPWVLASAAHAGRVRAAPVQEADTTWAAVPPAAPRRWRRRLFWRTDAAALALAFPDEAARDLEAPAAVVFSSGVTESPKGVVLSHFAVASNVTGVLQVLDPTADDVLLAASPVAHAFGFTVGLWLPLLSHLGVVWHGRPEDGPSVGAAVRRHGVTLLAASPHHLGLWLTHTRRSDLGSVRFAMAVGARLLPALRAEFSGRFGVTPVECYVASECGPVIAMNTPDVRALGVFHQGTKAGTVGHPLPGVTIEVVEPSTGIDLPPGLTGVLRVSSPGRMAGYLDDSERSAEVLQDGWYVSGDLGAVDEDGFVTLAGRQVLVEGERVPLQQVEQALRELAGTLDCPAAVLPSPDRRGRTRLMVVHARGCLEPRQVVRALSARGWPKAWVPAVRDFVAVDELPVTGAGLVDYQALRRTVSLPY